MINSSEIRDFFPSIGRVDHNNNQIIYLDGPGGTQVPIQVIEAISQYYIKSNANTHGEFITSQETDKVMDDLRLKMSEFLGSNSPETISIGQNMTSLNYSLARALSKKFNSGDEVIITELDHEANRGPWKVLEEAGVKLIEVSLLKNGELDYEDFRNKIYNIRKELREVQRKLNSDIDNLETNIKLINIWLMPVIVFILYFIIITTSSRRRNEFNKKIGRYTR